MNSLQRSDLLLQSTYSRRSSISSYFRKLEDFPIILNHEITLDIMRHAQTINNGNGLITGAYDVSLSKEGAKQTANLAYSIKHNYDIAWTSTLKRSQETLQILLDSNNISINTIYQDQRLNERSLGILENKPKRPIEEFSKGDFLYKPDGGENYLSVTKRSMSFLLDVFNYARNVDRPLTILLCIHMGTMRIISSILKGLENPQLVLNLSFKNTEIVRIKTKTLDLPKFIL
jgi:broad specificity phosphatase PhoE